MKRRTEERKTSLSSTTFQSMGLPSTVSIVLVTLWTLSQITTRVADARVSNPIPFGRTFPRPRHSNFLKRTNYLFGDDDGSQRGWQFVWCAHDASICKSSENPSGGTTCCWNRFCIDTKADPSNCGGCGKACVYGFTCCAGRCVDLLHDRKHCGSCNITCSHHAKCEFGMCGYAGDDLERNPKKKGKQPKHPW